MTEPVQNKEQEPQSAWDLEPDLAKRDPNDLNDHLQVNFEDVLGEPENIHSIDCSWRYTFKCFNLWKDLCYKIMTTVCGVMIGMGLGCEFAYIAFYHIWVFTPCMKAYNVNAACVRKFWQSILACCLDPLCESCGQLFHHFGKK